MTDRWEVWFCPAYEARKGVPEGWEPFSGTDTGVWLRRRVEPVQAPAETRPVLTARERAGMEWSGT